MMIQTLSRTAAIASACFALLSPANAQEGQAHGNWLTDFEKAKATAKKENKIILADFTGSDWCGWCIKLKNEVFSHEEFETWAKDKVVLLELDFPRRTEQPADLRKQNEELRKKYGVNSYPSILFLDAEGKQIGKTGYVKGGPAAWTAEADKILGQAQADDAWGTDYEAALKLAKKEKKLVLADFTGSDWCGWCIKLKEEVFNTPEFREWAEEHVVLLELDFPRQKPQSPELKKQNEELRDKHGIGGYPTILFLDSKGKKVAQTNYVKGGPEAWIAKAEEQLGIKSKKKSKKKDK